MNQPESSQQGNRTAKQTGICLISDDFLPENTGVGIYLQRVAPELARRGYRVTAITTRRAGEPAVETWKGVIIYRTFTIKMYGFYQALPSRATVRRILQDNDVDIVHYHYIGMLLKRTYDAGKGLRLKHIYTYHFSIDLLTKPLLMKPFRPLIESLYHRYCNRFDGILTPSNALVQQVQELSPAAPVTVMSNPVAFDGDTPLEDTSNNDMPTILFVGRLGPEKNLPYLFEAFATVLKSGIEAEVRIVGDGPERQMLEQLAERLGIVDRIIFHGYVKHADLPRHYANATIFVLPSLEEVQPMVVIEAMRFAKPVIVTNKIAAGPELVDVGQTGYIVNAADPNDLADRLTALLENTTLRQEMGEAARRKSDEYSLDTVVDRLEAYYAQLK